MTIAPITEGALLFHAVHGLCKIEKMVEQDWSGDKELCYSIVPKPMNKMKTRFTISVKGMENSGFHQPISRHEAEQILEYLKTGKEREHALAPAWDMARHTLNFSSAAMKTKDQRKRQMLERCVKGLAGELAFALEITIPHSVERILHSMGGAARVDRMTLQVLQRVSEI